jgi:acetolactate synthase-1/3 small subunit
MGVLMKHIISVTVENKPGVLARIVGLISGRGFNIESLSVAPGLDPSISKMTMTVLGDDKVLEQVNKQLNKLIDVIKVTDLTKERFIDRELIMVDIEATPEERHKIVEFAHLCDAKVISVRDNAVTIQMAGDREKMDSFMSLIKPYKVIDISRSGPIAIARAE